MMDSLNSLKERAEEMMKGNFERAIGPEEIITILGEYDIAKQESEKTKYLNRKLEDENKELKHMLDTQPTRHSNERDQIIMLTEIRDTLKRLEFDNKMKDLHLKYKEQEEKYKDAERSMRYLENEKMITEERYWNGDRYIQ